MSEPDDKNTTPPSTDQPLGRISLKKRSPGLMTQDVEAVSENGGRRAHLMTPQAPLPAADPKRRARRFQTTETAAVTAPPGEPTRSTMGGKWPDREPSIREIVSVLKDTRKRVKALEKTAGQSAPRASTAEVAAIEVDFEIDDAEEEAAGGDKAEPIKDGEVLDVLRTSSRILPSLLRKSGKASNRVDRFLQLMLERGASDLHLAVGVAPMFRDSGEIVPLRYRRLRQPDWERLLRPIVPNDIWERYEELGDADLAYEVPELGRFRLNLFRQERGGGAVFRLIPHKILTIDQLGLPDQIHRVPEIPNGLVLVTGPTGSGKSTTLAALVNKINELRPFHIITLEDPIEFVHTEKRAVIHQRQIGLHARAFSSGLRDAVREDPDLLLVGEMRDVETTRLALESAEKGLLVFGTLHTNNAAKTIDRIVSLFPSDEQSMVRAILSETLQAVVSQQLIKRLGGGRVAALEILFGSNALASLIRDGKTHQVTNLIQTGKTRGMIAMDDALEKLVNEGIISNESALEKAIDKGRFRDATASLEDDRALAEATRKAALTRQ